MRVKWRRAAAYAVCRDGAGRLLLARVSPGYPGGGEWTMPGGGMEWGEDPEATAIRELHEETGLSGTIGPVLGVYSRWFTEDESTRGEPGHVVGVVYEMTDLQGELRTELDGGTTDAVQWFDIDQIHSLPHVELVDFVLGVILEANA